MMTMETVQAASGLSNKADPRGVRKNHESLPGHAYVLTTTTLYRRPVFRDHEVANAVARVHTMKWVWRDSRLLAWVLMPDQWHALVILGQNDHLHTLMGRFKAASTKQVEASHKTNHWLWGRGYHDRVLRPGQTLRETARYLVRHPIRAGFAEHLGMYPYWNAVWLDAAYHDYSIS
jgi:putative transposase